MEPDYGQSKSGKSKLKMDLQQILKSKYKIKRFN